MTAKMAEAAIKAATGINVNTPTGECQWEFLMLMERMVQKKVPLRALFWPLIRTLVCSRRIK